MVDKVNAPESQGVNAGYNAACTDGDTDSPDAPAAEGTK